MTKAVRIHETGGPEVLKYEDVDVGAPGPGEVRLRQTAVGLNFIDVYHRSGLYPVKDLPAVLDRIFGRGGRGHQTGASAPGGGLRIRAADRAA